MRGRDPEEALNPCQLGPRHSFWEGGKRSNIISKPTVPSPRLAGLLTLVYTCPEE